MYDMLFQCNVSDVQQRPRPVASRGIDQAVYGKRNEVLQYSSIVVYRARNLRWALIYECHTRLRQYDNPVDLCGKLIQRRPQVVFHRSVHFSCLLNFTIALCHQAKYWPNILQLA
jgi:hypothetical protein